MNYISDAVFDAIALGRIPLGRVGKLTARYASSVDMSRMSGS